VRVALLGLCACGRIGFGDTAGADAATDAHDGGSTVFVISQSATMGTVFMSLDLATGELTYRANFSGFGILGGLAYWDTNTFYLAGANVVVEMTVSPLQSQLAQSTTITIQALERDGATLVGIAANGDVVRFAPGGTITAFPLVDTTGPIPVDGGDLAKSPSGDWLWWSNPRTQLYRLDLGGGQAVAIGPPNANVPYVSGMVFDDAGRLFITTGITDELVELDPASGAVVDRKPLCMPCPTTPFDLDSGDLTRAP